MNVVFGVSVKIIVWVNWPFWSQSNPINVSSECSMLSGISRSVLRIFLSKDYVLLVYSYFIEFLRIGSRYFFTNLER